MKRLGSIDCNIEFNKFEEEWGKNMDMLYIQ